MVEINVASIQIRRGILILTHKNYGNGYQKKPVTLYNSLTFLPQYFQIFGPSSELRMSILLLEVSIHISTVKTYRSADLLYPTIGSSMSHNLEKHAQTTNTRS